MGRFKQIVTHPQRETAEIIQQCNMEEEIQLTRTSSLYLQAFRICVRSMFWIQSPLTQHCHICVTVHPVIVPQPTPFRRRFNLSKAKWDDFSTDFYEAIEEVEHVPENYDIFICLIRVVFRRHITRGCRTKYIPGLTEELQSLYEAYKKQYSSNPFAEGTLETGNKFIDTMKEEKKKRWEEVITSIDLTHNSRKAWQTIKKLANDPTSPNSPCLVNSNQVAHHLLVNGQGTMPTKPKCPALPTVEGKPSLVSAFSEEEYRKGIAALKNNKAAGIGDILVKQLKNLGPKSHKWLHTMLNTCFIENKIPRIWRQSKIIAILKSGKESAIPKNYIDQYPSCATLIIYMKD